MESSTSNSSLDEQLKQAQIEKTRMESRKLEQELDFALKQQRKVSWSEVIKLLGGVVLGIGGAVAAYTQYEVAELKAKYAKQELIQADTAKVAAIAMTNEAIVKRDAAVRERQEAEQYIKGLKENLTRRTNQLTSIQPGLVKSRLAYIQFRGDMSRATIDELRKQLSGSSFDAPGAERIEGKYQNIVKYFSAADSADADRLARSIETFFASKGCPLKIPAELANTPSGKTSPLEVWLAYNCK